MTYILLLAAALCIELTMSLPVGSLPLLLEQEGSSREQIALAMGAGMFTALIASIPIGALTDRIGRLAIMRVALVFGLIAMTAMGITHGALAAGVLMGIRILALLSFITGEFAYGSSIVAKERAVSAVATMGIIGNFCFALGPAVAVWLWQHGLGREQFLWSDAILVIGGLLTLLLPDKHDVKISHGSRRRIFMRRTWLPASLFCLALTLQGGVNGTLAVLTFHDRGIANGAILFTASALTTVFLRYPAGRYVELYGPRLMSIPTAIIQAVGCLIAISAHSLPLVIASGICFGISWAAVVPVALALFFEQSSQRTRGAAMGVYNFAFGTGGAVGAALATLTTIYGNGYSNAIMICAFAPILSLPFVVRSSSPRATVRKVHTRSAI